MATDPYTAPRSRVADVPVAGAEGSFTSEGRAVPAGHGWKWITDGWGLFRRQPGTWILLLIVFVLISVLIALIPILGSIASNVLWPVFAGGIMLGCRELDQGGELAVGHLFAGFRDHLGKLVVIGILYLVALIVVVLVAFAITGAGIGFGALMGTDRGGAEMNVTAILLGVLLALALIIPVAMAVWFAPTLVVLNDLGVGDAVKASFRACLRNIIPFLVYGAIGIGLAIVASIPFGLGWLALGPTLAASVYAAYRDIFYTS
ncbi:MAG TPA: BPSS1780 family membrane protein [Burkholderiales bacterium]|nr:BPSS1780 family membrane protein [Burkholderiales bacterium]